MKTIRNLVTIFILGTATLASAVEKPNTNVQPLNSDQLLVAMQSGQESTMEVTIADKSQNIVYYKQSSKPISTYKKIFDVSYLDNGEYTIELKVNDLLSQRDLTIANNQIYVGKPDNARIIPPFFGFDGEQLVLTHLNFENEKYDLEIYDNQGLVYKASVGNDTPINAGFDLSKMNTGEYEVVLSSSNELFSYEFNK